jgi:hypothetical protein
MFGVRPTRYSPPTVTPLKRPMSMPLSRFNVERNALF